MVEDGGNRRPRPIEKFLNDRAIVRIEGGSLETTPVPIDTNNQSVVLFCRVFDEDGCIVKIGQPLAVTERENCVVISIEEPLSHAIQILYNVERDKDIDDDEWDKVQM